MTDWAPAEYDLEFFERELESFVPDRVFDAHAHFLHPEHHPAPPGLPASVGYDEYCQLISSLHPRRTVAALFLSFSFEAEQKSGANEWTGRHVAFDPNSRGSYFVTPDDDPEQVRQDVRRLGLHGLKCYHLFSHQRPTWETDIPNFLPETLVRIADEEGWVITLHIVKSRGVADPSNIYWIRRYCETYPNMSLILAHSARGFQPSHNLEGLSQLTGLDNLYFDTSANCEPMAHAAILRAVGHRKLMYGSDFPVSHLRGRSMAAADTFVWVYDQNPAWRGNRGEIKPTLVGLEHLRSLKWACWSERLSDSAVEDIFWNNAAELLGLR